MNDRVVCPECGAVRMRLQHGMSVCPNGYGKLIRNWSGRCDLVRGEPAGFVRLGRGLGRRRAYRVFGESARFRLAAGRVDGMVLKDGQILAWIRYGYRKDGDPIGRIRLLERISEGENAK